MGWLSDYALHTFSKSIFIQISKPPIIVTICIIVYFVGLFLSVVMEIENLPSVRVYFVCVSARLRNFIIFEFSHQFKQKSVNAPPWQRSLDHPWTNSSKHLRNVSEKN